MVRISETPAIAPATNCKWNGSGRGGEGKDKGGDVDEIDAFADGSVGCRDPSKL